MIKGNNQGSTLIMVLIAVLLLSLIAVSALTQSGTELGTARNFFMDKNAFYVADAGIQVGMNEIDKHFTNPTEVLLNSIFGKYRYYSGTMVDTTAQYVKAFMGFKAPPPVGQSIDMGSELNMITMPWQLTVTAVNPAGTSNQIRKQLRTVVITMVSEY